MKLRNLPTRAVTGAFILHTGFEKWSGGEEQANRGMSDVTVSVRFLPGRTVPGEVVDAERLPANGQVKAIAGSVVRDAEEVGG